MMFICVLWLSDFKNVCFTGFGCDLYMCVCFVILTHLMCVCVCVRAQSRVLGRAATRADNRISELQVLVEELQWDMEKIRRRENRLNTHLGEVLERVRPHMCLFVCVCERERQSVLLFFFFLLS